MTLDRFARLWRGKTTDMGQSRARRLVLVGVVCAVEVAATNPLETRAGTCSPPAATPVSAAALQQALRATGFSARVITRHCGDGAATVSNFSPTAQGAEERRAQAEGELICS